jgi:hypothetical protein
MQNYQVTKIGVNMSLKITNKATDKQVAMLHKLEYQGSGKYAAEQLSILDAQEILEGLFEEERLARQDETYFTEDNKWEP